MALRIVWSGGADGPKEVSVPLPISSISELRATVKQQFQGNISIDNFVLTDTVNDIASDEDVRSLKYGTTLLLTMEDRSLAAPTRERITFQPHPKTLTMAGDYEYFAAQGRHPFVYALAEFIDNSLRATRKNAPLPRNITISFVVVGSNAANAKGLICVTDNGCGMTKHELNDWAVMNYSMEERGSAPQEPDVANRGNGPGAGRFLNGDLSYFGVGSKNAAFFMGSCVKVATRKAGERYVHELCLAAEDLEQRYRNQEAVYEEDMVHRNPGDQSTLAPMEQPFGVTRSWVSSEVASNNESDAGFTRVIVGNLKPDVLMQLMDDAQGQHVCQELAHLYHYYLHGEEGNRTPGVHNHVLPNGEPSPDIALQYYMDSKIVWHRRLAEVDDDMETRLLRSQKSEMQFTMEVPNKGTVCGVLYYFPYENDHETVPIESSTTSKPMLPSPFAPTQMPLSQMQLTQMPRATQYPGDAGAGGLGGGEGGAAGAASDDEDGSMQAWRAPIFEAFWQGRLIPGARIETLPFIEAIRQKRSAQAKDNLPDEVFARLRGALFFGPTFKVTRNKLLFRDNLQEVLANAVPGDRNVEKRLREWLARCHATLDKSIRFEALADSKTQAALRSKLGEGITAFDRISNGQSTISKGDVVRMKVKPVFVGRVVHFTIPRAVREEGAYSNGRIHLEALPAEAHGFNCIKEFSLRRLECVLDEKELAEHTQRELARVPVSLRVEPMRYATGEAVDFAAGDSIPETSVSVMSAGGQKLVRAFYGGKKQNIVVTQRLWKLAYEGATVPDDEAATGAGDSGANNSPVAPAAEEPAAAEQRSSKRQKKGRKGKGKQDENAAPDADQLAHGGKAAGAPAIAAATAELILTVENKVPNKESYMFSRLSDGLRKAGHYALEYLVGPPVPGQNAVRLVVPLRVAAGAPTTLDVAGEGRATAAMKELALGETLAPLSISISDEHGNKMPLAAAADYTLRINAFVKTEQGVMERCKEVTVTGELEVVDGIIKVTDCRVMGSKRALAAKAGLDILRPVEQPTGESMTAAQRSYSQRPATVADLYLLFRCKLGSDELESDHVAIKMRAGAPKTVALAPDSTWGGEVPEGGDGPAILQLQNGQEVPCFRVMALDAWGNATAPTDSMSMTAVVESPALSPASYKVEFGQGGVAVIDGLKAAVSTKNADWDAVKLGVECAGVGEGTLAAIAAGPDAEPLELRVRVLPSSMPVAIRLMVGNELLPVQEVEDDDGPTTLAVLSGIEAGQSSGTVQVVLLDEMGNYAAMQANNVRVTCSWKKGFKKCDWKGKPLSLIPIQAPECVTEVANEWVRFQGNASCPVTLECGIMVTSIPGPANSWSVSLLDQINSQCPEDLGVVRCGEPFTLEIEALDKFNNRCGGGSTGVLPEPHIILQSEGPLQYDPTTWEMTWIKQGDQEIFSVKLSVSGRPGPVKVIIRDSAGGADESGGETSLLTEDSLQLELKPGPPAALVFEGPSSVACSTRAALSVAVRVIDAAGNRVDPTHGGHSKDKLDVLLCGSALSADASGRAAKVSVKGGSSKVRAVEGVARFAEVLATAEAPGSYTLRAQSGSRKFALEDAVITLVMQPQNTVTELAVTVPAELSDHCLAGSSGRLLVTAATEDGQPLGAEAAVSGLMLRVTPPGGNKADIALYNLQPTEDGSAPIEDGAFVFDLPEVNVAGVYSVAAEYSETRPEILAGMPKKNATVRSSTCQFTVLPGSASALTLEVPSLPDRLTATNGSSAKQRTLLKNVAVQLRDGYGNPTQDAGLQVRFLLLPAQGQAADQEGSLPQLQATEAEDVLESDANGRAFFGSLTLVEGSGTAPAGRLECFLVCQVLGLSPSADVEVDNDGWATCWRCPLLFCDDAARFATLEKLSERRSELTNRRAEITSRLDSARSAVAAATKEHQRVARQAASKAKAHPGPVPTTVQKAELRLTKLKQVIEQGGSEETASWHARYGNPKNPTTLAIDAALASKDGSVLGVLAQLMTTDDERLTRVASASLRSLLPVVVVKDMAARNNLHAMLQEQKHAVPDMLAMTHIAPFRGPKQGDIPAFESAGELAQAMTRAACVGTDRPIPMPLPHIRCLEANQGKVPAGGLGVRDWPKGCLGWLVNLVRPVHKGHRPQVLGSMLGSTLVFETMEQAADYREYVCQKLKSNVGDILTLDMGRISSKGIVSGSSFRPPPLDQADYLIGSTPGGQRGSGPQDAAAELALLEGLTEVLRAKEAAEAAVAAAEVAVMGEEENCAAELAQLEEDIAVVDSQLAHGNDATGAAEAAPGGAANGSKRTRQQREENGATEALQDLVQAEEQPQQGRTKRKRLTKMQ